MTDLDRLEGLHRAATPGPWRWSENGNVLGAMPDGYDEMREVAAVYCDDVCDEVAPPNAEFIIAMYNEWPALRDELRQHRELKRAVEAAPEFGMHMFCDDAGQWAASFGTRSDPGKRVRLVAVPQDATPSDPVRE